MKSLEWMSDALCAQVGPDLFFPEGPGNTVRAAKKVCAACPVKPQCDDHARRLEGDTGVALRHGAWGGKSPRERAKEGGEPASTERDQAIIRLTGRGMRPSEIAEQLDVGIRTVGRVKKAAGLTEVAA